MKQGEIAKRKAKRRKAKRKDGEERRGTKGEANTEAADRRDEKGAGRLAVRREIEAPDRRNDLAVLLAALAAAAV